MRWISKQEWDSLDAFQEMQYKKFCKKYKKQIKRYMKRLAKETEGMSAVEFLEQFNIQK